MSDPVPGAAAAAMRAILPVLSLLGFAIGVAAVVSILGAGAQRDPIVPLLLSLACAVGSVAWSADPARNVRRPIVIGGLSIIAVALVIAVPSVFFASAGRDVYPVGDAAILEIYTRHAARGMWTLGPYSQFGWNHPGPLYFYLLAPLYLLGGEKSIALHAGAFTINLLAVCAIMYTLIRYATAAVACAVAAALGVYLVRLQPVMASYWNPHIVILPAATFLVLTATLAAGRAAALPAVVLVGSFLVQTHVSLAPFVLALGGSSLGAAAYWWTRTQATRRSLTWWIHTSAWLLALLWLLPMLEQIRGAPGNLTRLLQFFGESSPAQDLRTAFAVWGEMMSALLQRQLAMPEGLPLTVSTQPITIGTLGAMLQAVLLAAACLDARRRQDRFAASLTAAGLLASLIALWSITRVKSLVGDYMVFWMSAIGTLNWAVLAGLAISRLAGLRALAPPRWPALAAAAVVVTVFLHLGVDELKRARRQSRIQPRGSARLVRLASEAVLNDMSRRQVGRPLFHMSTRAWGEAAGVLLQVYKRGVPPAVDASLVSLFGEPLAPNGKEDRVFVIADGAAHSELSRRTGDELVASVEGMYIHATKR